MVRRVMVMAVVLIGCGDDDKPAGDTRADGTGDASDSSGDVAEVSDATNASDGTNASDSAADTRPGDVSEVPLEGTALEGIAVKWPAAIELCNAWQEGATLEAEVAHEVRVSLPVQTRSDLTFDALASQGLVGSG